MKEKLTPTEVLALKKEISASVHCALPGTVESFDASSQTACVRPALKQKGILLPVIPDVPVFFPGSRDSAVTWPVTAGDECLLVFADADIDRWFEGEDEDPVSGRMHSLSDAFAFVGFRSRENVLENFPDVPRFFDGEYYTKSETDELLAGKADSGHKHAAGDITSGTLAIARGGSGRGSTGATSTIADIATAASGCTIETAHYAWWGKVAMIMLCVNKKAAVSSGTTTICTVASGKRPRYKASAQWGWGNQATIDDDGKVQVNGAISANANLYIYSTYVLA